MNNVEQDHEIRIQILEKIADGIDRRFEKLANKIDSQFLWIVGLILISIILPMLLHSAKLV